MDTKTLRQKILDLAIRGKLVPQDPNDEPASVLLERIRAEKQQMVKDGKLKPKDIKNDTIIFKGEDNLHYEQFQDGTVKCIEDEIPFEIPDGWEWCKINTIAFVTKLAGFEYTKNIAPNLSENGIPLFKGKNIQDITIIYEFESFIPESVSDELQRSQITKKCILTPYVGTIGNIGIHNRSGKYHLGSNVGKIELYNDNVTMLEEYVVSYLQSWLGYQQLTKHMKATAQASISIEAIREVYLPIPPANEQLRIWEALSKALTFIDCIANTESDIVDLITIAKSRILDLAIRGKLVPQDPNDEPAFVLLERIRAEKEELIKQGKIKRDKKESVIFKGEDNSYYEKIDLNIKKIDDEIPYQISNNWEYVRLSKICWLSDGTKIQNSKLPYLDVKSLRSCDFTNNAESGKYIKKETKIILVDGENSGEVFTVPCDGYMGSTFKVLETINCICNDYIKIILSYYKNMLKNSKTGSAIPHLNKVLFKSIIVGIPPIEEQIRIVHQVNSVFSLIDNII